MYSGALQGLARRYLFPGKAKGRLCMRSAASLTLRLLGFDMGVVGSFVVVSVVNRRGP